MAGKIKWDTSEFESGIKKLESGIPTKNKKAVKDVATEILRLSQLEVPHDKGSLQDSGHVEEIGQDEALIIYNTVYAARLHEHPEYNFQKGRKGKFLEDPIKNNRDTFKRIYESGWDF